MPDTPLNPEALDKAASVLCDETAGQHTRYADLKTGIAKKLWGQRAEHVVSAYLAVAQPEVTSEEELAKAWHAGFESGWGEAKDPGAFVSDVWDAKTPNPYADEEASNGR